MKHQGSNSKKNQSHLKVGPRRSRHSKGSGGNRERKVSTKHVRKTVRRSFRKYRSLNSLGKTQSELGYPILEYHKRGETATTLVKPISGVLRK